MDVELNSPTIDIVFDSTAMDIFPPFPTTDFGGFPTPTEAAPTCKTDAHSGTHSASTSLPQNSSIAERCNVLVERVQWLFQLDQRTYDAYGYEYSGLGLWPVFVRPRVDHTAAKELLLDILKTVDPYITNWVLNAERAVVESHLALLRLFKTAFEAYPAVRCWFTVRDALCRFLRVLLSTDDVTIDTIDSEISIYEREVELSGPSAIVDAQTVRNTSSGKCPVDDKTLLGRLSPIPIMDFTFNWDDHSAVDVPADSTGSGDDNYYQAFAKSML